METLKEYYNLVDKSSWPVGPWKDEPDLVNLFEEESGLYCQIWRHSTGGSLNGYVALPPSHKYYNKHYDNIDVDVHGGLTFAAISWEEDQGLATLHGNVLYIGEPGLLYWIGFDCMHWQDLSPGWMMYSSRTSEIYKDIEYLKNELTNLCKQL